MPKAAVVMMDCKNDGIAREYYQATSGKTTNETGSVMTSTRGMRQETVSHENGSFCILSFLNGLILA